MPEKRTRNSSRRKRENDAFDVSPATTLVNFSVVEIREFERVVGDNPSCSSGVPVSIGWNHGKTFTMNLEDFEQARPPRRAQMDLVLTRGERHRLLVEWGASGQDVIEAIRMIIRVKNQRRQTVNNLGSYDRVEEVFENVFRSAKRWICRTSPTTAAKKLQEDSKRAAAMKRMHASGQATSFTANETLTAGSTPTRKGRANSGRDPKPPCREVSVLSSGSLHNPANFDDGDFGHAQHGTASLSLSADVVTTTKTETELSTSEEYPAGDSSGCDIRIREGGGYRSEIESDEYVGAVVNRGKSTAMDGYDDLDDVSNPQSHDHHQTRRPMARVPIESVGTSIDI